MQEFEQFLDKFYPGSVLGDTHTFVRLEGATWFARTHHSGVTAPQMYADLFRHDDRVLATCVDMDLARSVPRSAMVETRGVVYAQDWGAEDVREQSFVAVPANELDAEGFYSAAVGTLSAAYVFSPKTGLALAYDGCFTPTAEWKAELQRRYPPLTR